MKLILTKKIKAETTNTVKKLLILFKNQFVLPFVLDVSLIIVGKFQSLKFVKIDLKPKEK